MPHLIERIIAYSYGVWKGCCTKVHDMMAARKLAAETAQVDKLATASFEAH